MTAATTTNPEPIATVDDDDVRPYRPSYRTDAVLIGLTVLMLASISRAERVAQLLSVSYDDAFWGALIGSCLMANILLGRFAFRATRSATSMFDRENDQAQRGTIAAEFILAAPILIYLLAIMVQTAQIGMAALVCRYAGFAACRTAIVYVDRPSFSQELGDDNFQGDTARVDDATTATKNAAATVLASISPASGAKSDAGLPVEKMLNTMESGFFGDSPWPDDGYARRYTYALEAIIDLNIEMRTPDLEGLNVPNPLGPEEVVVTFKYRYWLPWPAIDRVIGSSDTVSDKQGYFLDIPVRSTLQSTGPRQANPAIMAPLIAPVPLPLGG